MAPQWALFILFISRFIDLLGTIFGFVNKDIRAKLAILTAHRQGPAGESYTSVQSMVEYEITNKIIEKPAEIANGSRSLLRLHRAFQFIMGILEILKLDDDKVPLTTSVNEYNKKTLGQYHSWLIQQGDYLALYTSPHKEKLIQM